MNSALKKGTERQQSPTTLPINTDNTTKYGLLWPSGDFVVFNKSPKTKHFNLRGEASQILLAHLKMQKTPNTITRSYLVAALELFHFFERNHNEIGLYQLINHLFDCAVPNSYAQRQVAAAKKLIGTSHHYTNLHCVQIEGEFERKRVISAIANRNPIWTATATMLNLVVSQQENDQGLFQELAQCPVRITQLRYSLNPLPITPLTVDYGMPLDIQGDVIGQTRNVTDSTCNRLIRRFNPERIVLPLSDGSYHHLGFAGTSHR